MSGNGRVTLVEINWVANPWRGDKFEAVWRPAAEAVLDYGAHGYSFMRSRDDPMHFTQLAYFDAKIDFDRYWQSEEISSARVAASGLFQVPILPVWYEVITSGETPGDDS